MLRNPGNQKFQCMTKDQSDMANPLFAKEFEEIVETENGFMLGGKSYLAYGDGVYDDCDIAVCCLARAGYTVYRTTPIEIVRRLKDGENTSNPELDGHWSTAECYFIFDLFVLDQEASLSATEWGIVKWFITEAVNGGSVVVLPLADDDPDLNMYGETFGDFIEKEFERINGKTTTIKKRKNK